MNILSNKEQFTLSKSTGYGKKVFGKLRRIVEFEKKALKITFWWRIIPFYTVIGAL